MARPKKQETDGRFHHITLRLSEAEYQLVMEAAEEMGLSRSGYIRKILLDKPAVIRYEIVADMPELRKLTAELGKIGSNLNQIAKFFHMGGVRSKAMQDEIHECILKIFEMREDVRKMAGDYHGSFETHHN